MVGLFVSVLVYVLVLVFCAFVAWFVWRVVKRAWVFARYLFLGFLEAVVVWLRLVLAVLWLAAKFAGVHHLLRGIRDRLLDLAHSIRARIYRRFPDIDPVVAEEQQRVMDNAAADQRVADRLDDLRRTIARVQAGHAKKNENGFTLLKDGFRWFVAPGIRNLAHTTDAHPLPQDLQDVLDEADMRLEVYTKQHENTAFIGVRYGQSTIKSSNKR